MINFTFDKMGFWPEDFEENLYTALDYYAEGEYKEYLVVVYNMLESLVQVGSQKELTDEEFDVCVSQQIEVMQMAFVEGAEEGMDELERAALAHEEGRTTQIVRNLNSLIYDQLALLLSADVPNKKEAVKIYLEHPIFLN